MTRARTKRLDEASARALARAAEWRLMGLLLERPHGDWHREVARLKDAVRDPDLRAAAASALDASEGTYLALFGPGGPVPARMVGYRRFSDPGWVLSDLTRFYEAFAFRPRSEDPIDHVAMAVQFVGYLLLKEAFARGAGESEATAVTTAARERFIEEYLQPVAHPFAEKLSPIAPEYLLLVARALAARVPAPLPEPAGVADLEGDAAADLCAGCVASGD